MLFLVLFASCSIYILFIYSVKYCRPPQNVIRVCLHIVHIRVPWFWSPPQTWSSVRYVWIPVIYKAGIACPWHNYCTDLEQNMDTWHTRYAGQLSVWCRTVILLNTFSIHQNALSHKSNHNYKCIKNCSQNYPSIWYKKYLNDKNI